MSDLRAAVEGLEKFYFGKASRPVIRLDAVFDLIPEGAVLVTEETLAAALDLLWEERWGPLPQRKGQTTINLENAAAIIGKLREGT